MRWSSLCLAAGLGLLGSTLADVVIPGQPYRPPTPCSLKDHENSNVECVECKRDLFACRDRLLKLGYKVACQTPPPRPSLIMCRPRRNPEPTPTTGPAAPSPSSTTPHATPAAPKATSPVR